MCIEKELSDKSKYPIFARTAVTGYELASTVHELLRYYKWKKISIIWNNRYPYKKLYEELHSLYKEDILFYQPISWRRHRTIMLTNTTI